MSSDTARAPKARSAQRSALVTLLRGHGSPRLYLRALITGVGWSLLIVFLYPYALDIAGVDGSLRYLGLVLLVLVAFAAYRALRAFGRVLWHFGLVWLAAGLLVIFLALATTRLRSGVASTWPDAASMVVAYAEAWLDRRAGQLAAAPGDIYTAATGQPPPWRPKPTAVLDPVTLERTANDEQLVLASESEPDGITRGALVQVVTKGADTTILRATPDASARKLDNIVRGALMIVVDGPRKSGDTIWWKVSAPEHEGWCLADALTLVSR
jgi:hypothetical protein